MEIIFLQGCVGKDAEVKESNGRTYTQFSLAVDKSYKDKNGQRVSRVNWWTIFHKSDKLAQHIKKGQYLTVSGEPRFGTWKNDQGITLVQLSINCENLSFGGSGRNSDGNQSQNTAPAQSNSNQGSHSSTQYQTPQVPDLNPSNPDDDDLPF